MRVKTHKLAAFTLNFVCNLSVCDLCYSMRIKIDLQIDQMSIKIESSRNITNMSAIDPKVRLQMATSVCVFDFKLIKCRL